jgi:predicted enzyme related to lactoylglutathione lyase
MQTPQTFAYVADAPASAKLYSQLFGTEPVQSGPDFAMFAFPNGTTFGVWGRSDVKPKPDAAAGAVEFAFAAAGDDEVKRKHDEWQKMGLKILQAPTSMSFGFTFTAADPDGHRLRVYAPAAM